MKASKMLNLLPGPVNVSGRVQRALGGQLYSHRQVEFSRDFISLKRDLSKLAGTRYCQITTGSGTLANDIIAQQLTLLPGMGMILINGEFGNRLYEMAWSAGLHVVAVNSNWGESFDMDQLEEALAHNPEISWVWFCHCETSTGMLNPYEKISRWAQENDLLVCVDAMSTLGNVPVNYSDAFLVSGTSGKGLGSAAGLSLIFHNKIFLPKPGQLPVYLDLGHYFVQGGTAFTVPSNLVYGLKEALSRIQDGHFSNLRAVSGKVSRWLDEMDLDTLVRPESNNPSVLTIPVADEYSSSEIGDHLYQKGIAVSYQSEYLKKMNWIQVCLMGELGAPFKRRLRLRMRKFHQWDPRQERLVG
ncbi:alanine--glyoxylate aminotransferase family protein [bacterium SCSIO 12741]|nr:alanine--glyoxylate aminotransferase family protein [bacterium SCSIO 12741]